MNHNQLNIHIPWVKPGHWRQANASIAHHLRLYSRRLGSARQAARTQACAISLLEPVMEALCRRTCARCHSVCCRHATVWFDFRDLLFIHLYGLPQPLAQPISGRGEVCRYLDGRGCRLPRLQRPFICTWYLCPDLKGQVAAEDTVLALENIKQARAAMESDFLAAVCP